MTNVGKERLDIAQIGLPGTNPHDFQQSNDCGTRLAIASSCQIDVTFDPKSAAGEQRPLRSPPILVAPNQSITVFGVATSVKLSPSSLNFGNQKIGTVSDPQTVTFTNVGNKPVHLSPRHHWPVPQIFLQTNNCGTTVAPGASCAINVQFAPQLKRVFIESLAVKDDGGGQMQTVQVTGTGT